MVKTIPWIECLKKKKKKHLIGMLVKNYSEWKYEVINKRLNDIEMQDDYVTN